MTDERSVLIATADRLYAESAAAFFNARPGWRVTATESDAIGAVATAVRLRPDAILVVGEITRVGAAGFARELRRRNLASTVVLVGHHPSPDATVLPRDATAEDVLGALSAAGPGADGTHDEAERRAEGMALLRTLTPQERIVLRLLAEGLTLPDVAARLGVSRNTARTHIQNVYAKLRCHKRVDVVHFAHRHGIVGYRAREL